MNFTELIELLLAKISYSFYAHNTDSNAHNLNSKFGEERQIVQVSTQELVSYADEQGMLNTYTIGSGTKDQFYNDVESYIVNNWGVSSSDYDFGVFVAGFTANTRNYLIPGGIILIYYYDELWDNKETVYIYDYANSIVKKIGTDTKTLTVTYTDETTEDIEFYIK
ncbi:MAG: hypothetical protein J6B87_07235 [Clostridia bacterium]|nr:hypothetical protein [Clostridia bacterium]